MRETLKCPFYLFHQVRIHHFSDNVRSEFVQIDKVYEKSLFFFLSRYVGWWYCNNATAWEQKAQDETKQKTLETVHQQHCIAPSSGYDAPRPSSFWKGKNFVFPNWLYLPS